MNPNRKASRSQSNNDNLNALLCIRIIGLTLHPKFGWIAGSYNTKKHRLIKVRQPQVVRKTEIKDIKVTVFWLFKSFAGLAWQLWRRFFSKNENIRSTSFTLFPILQIFQLIWLLHCFINYLNFLIGSSSCPTLTS